MIEYIKLTPESFNTIYDREANGQIVEVNGKRVVITRVIPIEWKAVRVYDYELQLNENKKEIVLVEQSLYPSLDKQFKRLIST